MFPYQKILVGIDGSEESFNAFKGALSFAKKVHATVSALYVLPIGAEVSSALSIFTGMRDLFRKGAEKVLKEAKSIAEEEGIEVKVKFEEGEPYVKLVDTLYAEGFDLLVLGKSGKGGVAKALLGSTVSRAIGASPVDILVIPKNTTLKFKKILVPVDGSIYSEEAALRALDLASYLKCEVILLSVVEIPFELYESYTDIVKMAEHLKTEAEDLVRKLKMKFKERGVEVKGYVLEGIVEEKIIDSAEKEEVDLIVMGSHGKTGLKRLLMGSVTEKVLTLGNKPVLIVKRSL